MRWEVGLGEPEVGREGLEVEGWGRKWGSEGRKCGWGRKWAKKRPEVGLAGLEMGEGEP